MPRQRIIRRAGKSENLTSTSCPRTSRRKISTCIPTHTPFGAHFAYCQQTLHCVGSMKTGTALSWILLVGMLACGTAQATSSDRGGKLDYVDATHTTWLHGGVRPVARPLVINNQRLRDPAISRAETQVYSASVSNSYRTRGYSMANLYALGCVIYVAFIFLLGLFVGFNKLDSDKPPPNESFSIPCGGTVRAGLTSSFSYSRKPRFASRRFAHSIAHDKRPHV